MGELFDLQVNGWAGVDFSDPLLDRAAIERAASAIVASGTDRFLATLITSPWAVYRRNLPLLARACADGVPGLAGIHCEGPFFESTAAGALGAHDPRHCRAGTTHAIDELRALAEDRLRLLTIGADRPEAAACCTHASAAGICVALGHHLADARQIADCADAGARLLIHLGNGLPHRIDRHHNPLWAGLAEERLAVAVIADGHHLPLPMLRVLCRTAGDRLVVTSDAAPVAGLPPGEHRCLGHRVELGADGAVRNPETGFLVGSGCSLSDCVAHLRTHRLLGPAALAAASRSRPAQLIGVGAPV